ncbi:MAG: hypothetical protein ABI618_03985 [Nitrospirota bacterium]
MREQASTDQSLEIFTKQINRVKGQVIWIQEGFRDSTLKLRVGEALDLKVRGNHQDKEKSPICLGQWLEVEIPSDAIYLVTPEHSPAKGRWTQWEGRIVLGPRPENDPCLSNLTTVKVRDEQLTLHSQRLLGASSGSTQVGDRVALLIDPRAVGIRSVADASPVAQPSHGEFGHNSVSPLQPKRVRLPGTIIRTRQATVGVFVTLRIGQAAVSAHVTGEEADADLWPPGRATALIVGHHEAWIQSFGMPMTPCHLVDLASEEETSRRPSLKSQASGKSLQI